MVIDDRFDIETALIENNKYQAFVQEKIIKDGRTEHWIVYVTGEYSSFEKAKQDAEDYYNKNLK